jgi:hypothetical protein
VLPAVLLEQVTIAVWLVGAEQLRLYRCEVVKDEA